MAQFHTNATVTSGSANVTLPGDVRDQIKAGDYFKLVGIVGVYEIASAALSGSNTRITLTATYVGDSGEYPALIHRDFTERGYPLFYEGDLDIPDILRRWALQMDGEVTHAEDVAGDAVAEHVAQPDPHPQYLRKSENLADVPSKPTARANLGLGSASTSAAEDFESSTYTPLTSTDDLNDIRTPGKYAWFSGGGNTPANSPLPGAGFTMEVIRTLSAGRDIQICYRRDGIAGNNVYFRSSAGSSNSWSDWCNTAFIGTGPLQVRNNQQLDDRYMQLGAGGFNTTVDSNGFIKQESPIIQLYDTEITKTDHLEIEQATLEKLGAGHYVLHGVPLLSRDGWYIETPRDRNGNIYFYLDYEEDEVAETLTIRTYAPDYSTGPATAGAPTDILEGRFVALRFAENPALYP